MNCPHCKGEINLREHDAELKATLERNIQGELKWLRAIHGGTLAECLDEVRKPLVDLLEEWTTKHGRDSTNWKDCELADRSRDALAKAKEGK